MNFQYFTDENYLGTEMLLCAIDAGFLFVFKACPVLDTGARQQQQARSTGKCKCRLRQDAGCDHSKLCNRSCNAEDRQKDKQGGWVIYCELPKAEDEQKDKSVAQVILSRFLTP
jgi:hypothetical protein